MKMMKCSIAAIVFAASQLAAAADGDTWRYTGTSSKSDAFSQAQYWTDGDGNGNVGVTGAALEPDDYYLVENYKILWTPDCQVANTNINFVGKRLTLGEAGTGKRPGFMEIRNKTATTVACLNNLVLANGWIKARGYMNR